jgi:flavorubredoxin
MEFLFNNDTFTTHFKNDDIEVEQIEEYLFGRTDNEDDKLIDVKFRSIATLHYKFTAEVRTWGIKSIYTDIQKFDAEIEWSVEKNKYLTDEQKKLLLDNGGYESKNNISGVIKIDTKKQKYDITNDIEFESDGGYHFDMVYINPNKKELVFVS